MTKRKLRKNADISPPQSPHDDIHTCSKGCKKPGCNRTLRDTIEEQDRQIEALKRDVLEKTAELRNLKEVVHDLRISAEDDLDSIDTAREEIARLQAELRKSEEHNAALCERMQDLNSELFAASNINGKLHMNRVHDLNHMGGLCEENARLRSVAEDNKRECEATRLENARLKSEVERMTKAGDAMAEELVRLEAAFNGIESAEAQIWYIAKEGGCP
jgi:chromosome segregation ATPase